MRSSVVLGLLYFFFSCSSVFGFLCRNSDEVLVRGLGERRLRVGSMCVLVLGSGGTWVRYLLFVF